MGFPDGTIPQVGGAKPRASAPNISCSIRTATPTCAPLSESFRSRKPGSAESRPCSPRPPQETPFPRGTLFCSSAAPAGLERHRRKRRGPSAGDGLGHRGALRAHGLCTEREHGGTQAVSRRSGSPREAWSEGPTVLHSSGAGERRGDRTRWPRKLWRRRGRSLRALDSPLTHQSPLSNV